MSSSEPTTKYVEDMTEEELLIVVENKLNIDPKVLQDAKNGDLEAKYTIAENYFDKGRYPHAKSWCAIMAKSGYAMGHILMGKIISQSSYGEKPEEVEEWFEKAYECDPVNSAYEIGEFYRYNYQHEEALKWYMRAGQGGHKIAQYQAGLLLNQDDEEDYSIIPVDKHKALEWFQKSADQGYDKAIRLVEELNEEGYYSVAKLKSNLTMLV